MHANLLQVFAIQYVCKYTMIWLPLSCWWKYGLFYIFIITNAVLNILVCVFCGLVFLDFEILIFFLDFSFLDNETARFQCMTYSTLVDNATRCSKVIVAIYFYQQCIRVSIVLQSRQLGIPRLLNIFQTDEYKMVPHCDFTNEVEHIFMFICHLCFLIYYILIYFLLSYLFYSDRRNLRAPYFFYK